MKNCSSNVWSDMMEPDLYKNYISTHFENIHENIENDFKLYHRYYKKNYLKQLPNDKKTRILDIGCGMGHFLNFLEKEGYENYLGIDISEENIEFCKEKNFNVRLCNVFDYLKENSGLFDTIIMNDVIEHFDKQEIIQLLKLVHRNLIINGKLIIKVVNASNPILGNSSRYVDFTHEIGFTEESLSQVLKVCGYKDVRIYPQNIYIFYLNPINYIAKIISNILNFIFRLCFIMYGRKTTKIFTKDIIAVAKK